MILIDGLEKQKALIRFYLGEDVDNDLDKFAKLWGQLEFALKFDDKLK